LRSRGHLCVGSRARGRARKIRLSLRGCWGAAASRTFKDGAKSNKDDGKKPEEPGPSRHSTKTPPILLLFLGWVLSRFVPHWRKASYAPSAVAVTTLLLLFWIIPRSIDLTRHERALRLHPLPFFENGVWPDWASGLTVLSLIVLGVGWLLGQIELFRALLAKPLSRSASCQPLAPLRPDRRRSERRGWRSRCHDSSAQRCCGRRYRRQVLATRYPAPAAGLPPSYRLANIALPRRW
jgi:hypothetical protein